MPMKAPFTTSFGTVDEKELLLIEAKDKSGITGWGETVAFVAPWYTEETLKQLGTCYKIFDTHLVT